MLKKITVLIGIAVCISCQARRPELQPPAGPYFQSLVVKFNFHEDGSRQNGRVHWRFDERSSKFLFFTPLNQVGLELDAAGEEAVLVNFAKKIFWKGKFATLLQRLWGIELTLDNLKRILVKGTVPRDELKERGITATLKKNSGSGSPDSVLLRRGSAELLLKISRADFRPGLDRSHRLRRPLPGRGPRKRAQR